MLFNSWSYAFFLPIVFILYWAMPHRYRWCLILVSSYYFYMSWNAKYVFLILFTSFVSYATAILIEKQKRKAVKKVLLVIALAVSLGILFFFKYFNFFNDSIIEFLNLFSLKLNPVTLNILLPVGISFYTFQTLSYVIDVYRQEVKPEYNFGKYAAFISFFPQLVAGPIERSENLLPQIIGEHTFKYKEATYGLKLMAWGFFKKMVVADTLAIYVNTIYDNVYAFEGLSLIIATVFFSFQIYCDFSGYSDIAIGTSKLFGINLMKNFDSPYFSSSIKMFWGRWHISLSTWFRDYVYIPMGGSRVKKTRHNFNLIITFLLSGLWHGANWNYIVWGGIHGVGQVLESNFISKKVKKVKYKYLKMILVFIFVSFSWIFFRSQNISDAFYVISNSLNGINEPLTYIITGVRDLSSGVKKFILCIILIISLLIYDFISIKRDVILLIDTIPLVFRWLIYFGIIIMIMLLTPLATGSEFIYFQF